MSVNCRIDPRECWCADSGWILSDWDSWHKCHIHFESIMPHPDSEPEDWHYWEDTVNGNGQFMIIPLTNTEQERHDQCWANLAKRIAAFDAMGGLPF